MFFNKTYHAASASRFADCGGINTRRCQRANSRFESTWPGSRAARQRPSKINGRDAAPSGSHICGEAALVWESYLNSQTSYPTHQRPADGASAPESWDGGGAPSLPFRTKGGPIAQSARQRPSKLGGRCSVGAHFCGEAAFTSSRDGALRLRLGTTRRSALHLERRGRQTRKRRGSATRSSGGRCSVGAHFRVKISLPF